MPSLRSLLLLPAALAAPTTNPHSTDKSLELLDASAPDTPCDPSKGKRAYASCQAWHAQKADAPLLMIKLDRTGSSWFAVHVHKLHRYSDVRAEINNGPRDEAVAKYGDISTGAGYEAYCNDASWKLVQLLKGDGEKYGAGTLNPFKQPDLTMDADGKLQWRCMSRMKDEIQKAVQAGEFPAPKIAVLTRNTVVHQAISWAKGKAMDKNKVCAHPYTEVPDDCPERFTYKFSQDPKELLDVTHEIEHMGDSLWGVAQALQAAWGSKELVAGKFEDFVAQGQGKGLALTSAFTTMLGLPAEGPDTAGEGVSSSSNKAGQTPQDELLNYNDVWNYFNTHAPKEWVAQLES